MTGEGIKSIWKTMGSLSTSAVLLLDAGLLVAATGAILGLLLRDLRRGRREQQQK